MYDGGDCIGDNVKIGMEEGQMNHVFHGQDEDQQVSIANPYKVNKISYYVYIEIHILQHKLLINYN